jgi:hypothetical protein
MSLPDPEPQQCQQHFLTYLASESIFTYRYLYGLLDVTCKAIRLLQNNKDLDLKKTLVFRAKATRPTHASLLDISSIGLSSSSSDSDNDSDDNDVTSAGADVSFSLTFPSPRRRGVSLPPPESSSGGSRGNVSLLPENRDGGKRERVLFAIFPLFLKYQRRISFLAKQLLMYA